MLRILTPRASSAAILTFDFLLIKGKSNPLARISVKCKRSSLLLLQNSETHLQANFYTSVQGSIVNARSILQISST